MKCYKSAIVVFALSAILLSGFLRVCLAVDQADAEKALDDAENALASAYLAVVEAENAGANVSDLNLKLQIAGKCLANASNAFRLGNFGEAYNYALNCTKIVEGLIYEAKALKEETLKSREERLFVSAACSSVGLSFLFVFSLFGWRPLKAFYVRRVLKMKPEVVEENEHRRP
jgi:hypothetical protein